MKNVLTLAFLFFTYSYANAQKENNLTGPEYKLDYKDPISIVNGMIEASKKKDLKLNLLVFDPFIERGEFYKYRMVYFTNDQKAIEELHDIRNSYVNGSPIISEDGMSATVPMWYKSSIREHQEQIHLTNRYGNWYISGF